MSTTDVNTVPVVLHPDVREALQAEADRSLLPLETLLSNIASDYVANGPLTPKRPTTQARTRAPGRDLPLLKAFLDDCCVQDVDRMVSFRELFDAWSAYAAGRGVAAGSVQAFHADLQRFVPTAVSYRPYSVDGKRQPRHLRGIALQAA